MPGKSHLSYDMLKLLETRGFSLVELIVAVAVIAILCAVSIPQYRMFLAEADRTEAKLILKNVYTAEMAYFSASQTFLPTNCPIGSCTLGICEGNNPINMPPILRALGIDYVYTTPHGWTFNNQYHFGIKGRPEFVEGRYITTGFVANLTKDLDQDPGDVFGHQVDWWVIQSNWNSFSCVLSNAPEGYPVHYFDDIRDMWLY